MALNFKKSVVTTVLLLVCTLVGISFATQDVRIGLMLEGAISDLGINFNVNAGLIATEKNIDVAASKVISSVDSVEATISAIEYFADNGYNMIISSSLVQAPVAQELAQSYPNIYFLIFQDFEYGTKYGFSANTAVYFMNLMSSHYLLGYMVGVSSAALNLYNIGMVVPGPPVENYFTANSFYAGLKESNANASLMVIATSSYDDPDTADGAIAILQTKNLDLITQSQTEMTVSVPFLYQSKLGLGTNGFPQMTIYGTKILQSVVADYSVPFTMFASWVINESWVPNYQFFGDFKNDFLSLDEFSFLVPEEAQDLTNAKASSLKSNPLQNNNYLCNQFNLATYGNYCISYEDAIGKSSKLYDGITDLGYYAVPTYEVYETKGINIAFISVSAVEIFLCVIVFFTIVIFFRNNINFTYSTIGFVLSILLGASLVGVAVILWNLRNLNEHICHARIWAASLGYMLLLGMIIVKNTLVHFKFNSMIRTKTDTISPIPFTTVLKNFIPLLLVDLVLLAVFSGAGDVTNSDSLDLDGIGKYAYTQSCTNNTTGNILLYIILIYHGLQLIYGCFITWKTRINDLEEFTEVHDFASAIYLITFCSFIIIPLMAGIQVHRNRNTIISACGIFTSFSCILIIFGAKFWKVYKPVEDDGLPQIKLQNFRKPGNSSSGGSGNSSKSKGSTANNAATPQQAKSKDIATSVNIQNWVNPIEAQSRATEEKEKEKERVQQILNEQKQLDKKSKRQDEDDLTESRRHLEESSQQAQESDDDN